MDKSLDPDGKDPMPNATSTLHSHLIDNGLAGEVATTAGNTLRKCREISEGVYYSCFGLFDPQRASGDLPSMVEPAQAIALVAGDPEGRLVTTAKAWEAELGYERGSRLREDKRRPSDDTRVPADPQLAAYCERPGWIDPDLTLASIEAHRATLAHAARTKARVLCATGHPTCLQVHYAPLLAALESHGATILTPAAEQLLPETYEPKVRDNRLPRPRYYNGVAMLSTGANLYHTHRPDMMVALLAALAGVTPPAEPTLADQLPELREHVDLVIADHGQAGAAIARGIPTLSIADVNDVALPYAQMQGRTQGVLCIDDNLEPRLYAPITEAMLAGWA